MGASGLAGKKGKSRAAGSATGRSYPETLRSKGKTFHWASRFLGRRLAADVALLYAFCRYLDDLADASSRPRAAAMLRRVRGDLIRGSSPTPVVADFIRLAERCAIPIGVVHALIDALQQDLGPVCMRDWQETLRYSHGVAGTVGLMFCAIAGVREQAARPFAIDLGVAMQLTNMARDVLEDAGMQRLYLPLCNKAVQGARGIRDGDPASRAAAWESIGDALDRADLYYRSADRGMTYLPWRVRAAVLVAARCYEAIGPAIRRRGDAYWAGRVRLRAGTKLWHSLRALASLLADPRYWGWSRPAHRGELHAPLVGLAGVDPLAQ